MIQEKERKVAVFVDAGADLPSNEILKSKYGIEPITQIPLYVRFGKDEYITGKSIDNEKFQELIHSTNLIPKTSAMSPGIYYPIYKESIEKGLKILSIHMGDNLSSTEQQARMATRELNGKKRCIFNTGTVSMAEGYMAIKAEELAAAGKDLDEIFQTLKGIKTRTSLRAITPNIPFIEKSGRVPKFETKLAKLFNIVPILQIDNGISEKVAKAISMERALSWTTRFVVKKSVERVTILDFEANENANRLYEKLIKNNIPEEIIYRETLGPVTGSHGGPGTLAVSVVRK